MKLIYENFLQNVTVDNPHLMTLLRYACKVKHITIIGAGVGYNLLTVMTSGCKNINLYNPVETDVSDFHTLAESNDIKFKFITADHFKIAIETTDLLYIDTMSEANFKFTELVMHSKNVNRYIILPGTYKYAHDPEPGVALPNGGQPFGVIHGINAFISENPEWHILEQDYYNPGITVLYRRKDMFDDGR